MTPTNNSIVDFYTSAAPDHKGRYLTEILKWSDDELERVHDYIQWLFPLPQRSGFNVNAPVLDGPTIQEFRSRPDLQLSLRASFVRMLQFYGLEFVAANPPTVRSAPFFAERSQNWLTPSNHNHLRITRILKSSRIVGLETEATAFFNCLADICQQESMNAVPSITEATFCFWKSATRAS